MPKRIVLDREYIARVKKDNAPLMAAVATMEQKKIPCKFCKLRTIDKYEDLQGHFSAFCNRCGQVAVYNAADYRHYSYLPHTRPVATMIATTDHKRTIINSMFLQKKDFQKSLTRVCCTMNCIEDDVVLIQI